MEECGTENLVIAYQLMKEVCERENCKQALARVKANKGSASDASSFMTGEIMDVDGGLMMD